MGLSIEPEGASGKMFGVTAIGTLFVITAPLIVYEEDNAMAIRAIAAGLVQWF